MLWNVCRYYVSVNFFQNELINENAEGKQNENYFMQWSWNLCEYSWRL